MIFTIEHILQIIYTVTRKCHIKEVQYTKYTKKPQTYTVKCLSKFNVKFCFSSTDAEF